MLKQLEEAGYCYCFVSRNVVLGLAVPDIFSFLVADAVDNGGQCPGWV